MFFKLLKYKKFNAECFNHVRQTTCNKMLKYIFLKILCRLIFKLFKTESFVLLKPFKSRKTCPD